MPEVLFVGGPLHGQTRTVPDGATRHYAVDGSVADTCDNRGGESHWPPLVGYQVRADGGGRLLGVAAGVDEAGALRELAASHG